MVDENLVEERTFELLVRPEGWTMPDEASRINGLTMEILAEKGVPIVDALRDYCDAIDEGYVIVAFNAQYDTKIMRGEMRRAGIDDRFERTSNICVMRALTDICRIPKTKGNGYKFPKLAEACAHFRLPQDAAHRAMGDARSALDLFRELHKLRMVPAPSVHFAKTVA